MFAGPLWAQTQVTPLLLRLLSTLYLLGHLGHQFPSTTLQTVISEARLPWGGGGSVESRPELQPGELRLSATKAVVLASERMAQTLCPRTMTKPLTSKGEHQGGAESNSSPLGTAARAEAGRL